MRYTDFLDTFLIRGHSQKRIRALTLVELLLTVAIIGTLSAIAVPSYSSYIDRARNSKAITDIREIELGIVRFRAERGRLPNPLAETGLPTKLDPWGRPYVYTALEGLTQSQINARSRFNKMEKPLNHDFDLYSMGKDGKSVPRIDKPNSYDDIIRASSGAYVGPASEY